MSNCIGCAVARNSNGLCRNALVKIYQCGSIQGFIDRDFLQISAPAILRQFFKLERFGIDWYQRKWQSVVDSQHIATQEKIVFGGDCSSSLLSVIVCLSALSITAFLALHATRMCVGIWIYKNRSFFLPLSCFCSLCSKRIDITRNWLSFSSLTSSIATLSRTDTWRLALLLIFLIRFCSFCMFVRKSLSLSLICKLMILTTGSKLLACTIVCTGYTLFSSWFITFAALV